MAHIINDLSLADGFLYQELTGRPLADFGKVARYRQLNLVAQDIINRSLSDIYDIMCNEMEITEGAEEHAELVYQFVHDAFGVQEHAWDADLVDKDAVRMRAYEMVQQAQLGVSSDDYTKCVACLVWLWRGREQATFEEFLANTSMTDLETQFMELVVESGGGTLPKDDGDTPLETASTPI